jgi:hypothetical protein
MMNSSRRPSPALILSIIAIVLALTGTTYAGIHLARAGKGGCPSGTKGLGPGCIETHLRPAQGLSQAAATCAKAGRRLPTASELLALVALGRSLGNPELVGDISPSGGGGRINQTVIYPDGRQELTESLDTKRRFRCVAP